MNVIPALSKLQETASLVKVSHHFGVQKISTKLWNSNWSANDNTA
jgi:hypothetical protein